jgi:hypothetical protein
MLSLIGICNKFTETKISVGCMFLPWLRMLQDSQIQNSTIGTEAENNVVTYLTNEDFGIAAQWRGGTLKALNWLDNVVNV